MQRVLSLIQWDPRWGYTHWHQFIHDSSGFRVSAHFILSLYIHHISWQVMWFSNPVTRDIVIHALPTPDSVGYFSIVPQQHLWS